MKKVGCNHLFTIFIWQRMIKVGNRDIKSVLLNTAKPDKSHAKPSRLMMYLVCYVLLLTFVGGEALSKISIQRGHSMILFPKVDRARKEIPLYTNGKTNYTKIVTFKDENRSIRPYWTDHYTNFRKLSMDSDRNILIDNFDESYAGTYCLPNPYYNDSVCIKVKLDIQAEQQDDLESDQCPICIASAAGIAGVITAVIAVLVLIWKIKLIQDQLWKRVFKTYMGKLTVTEVGTDIHRWLDKHPEFNYGRDTGERDNRCVQLYENENVDVTSLQLQNIFNMRQYDSHRSAMEEANPLLLKGQAADQSSAPQQHLDLPSPENLPRPNQAPDRYDVGSSEA